MNQYHPKFKPITEQIPVFSIQKDPRFRGVAEKNREQLKNVPNQYVTKFKEYDQSGRHHITSGKCWTLKMAKEDETTPGPAYQTQYLRSIAKQVEDTDELKNGSFGAHKSKHRTIPNRGFEVAYLGQDSPGPMLYNSNKMAKVKAALSVTRNSNKYSIGKVSSKVNHLKSQYRNLIN